MTAYSVVRMRTKPEGEAQFLELTREPGHEVKKGLRKGTLVKTGERSYCFVAEWDDFDAIVAARPDMIEDMHRLRPLLEDLGGGLGVTDAVSGSVVAEHIPAETFDFAAFKRAFENQDVETWLDFYADDAEWVEYRHNAPPRAPNRMIGKAQIGDFLRRVKASNIGLSISDEVIADGRAAFRVTAALANDKRVIENVIVHIERGKITRQTDVEAWDQ